MSNRNSQKSQFPAWQARHKNERFARLSYSMEESPAWNALGGNAIRLHFKCMAWTYDAENRKKEKASEKLYPRDKWPDSPNIKDGDFFFLADAAPGRVHYIWHIIFAIGCNHQYRHRKNAFCNI